MKNWRQLIVAPETSIRDALAQIDSGAARIVVVVDKRGVLAGTLTDGDVRRGLLRGVTLDGSVSEVMNPKPTTASLGDDLKSIMSVMNRKHLHHIPVIDDEQRLVGLETLDEFLHPTKQQAPVVLMAGGKGSRLLPLTEDTPKPLLPVGAKPILETILETFVQYGFSEFYLSVNYHADKIARHFEDGAKWNVSISYIHEEKPLGTAGALSLLPKRPDSPFIVMNADLLTNCNFIQLLDYHTEHGAAATMAVQKHRMRIPYGVAKLDRQWVQAVDEKPTLEFFVNAGLYVLNPDALDLIPKNQFYDMPSLINALAAKGARIGAFPVREYWLDIGRANDYEQANDDFSKVFEQSDAWRSFVLKRDE